MDIITILLIIKIIAFIILGSIVGVLLLQQRRSIARLEQLLRIRQQLLRIRQQLLRIRRATRLVRDEFEPKMRIESFEL